MEEGSGVESPGSVMTVNNMGIPIEKPGGNR